MSTVVCFMEPDAGNVCVVCVQLLFDDLNEQLAHVIYLAVSMNSVRSMKSSFACSLTARDCS